MHPLCGALPLSYVPVRATRGTRGGEIRGAYTPGGRTGKVLASHAEDAGSRPVKAAPIYMYCAQVALGGYCPVQGGG